MTQHPLVHRLEGERHQDPEEDAHPDGPQKPEDGGDGEQHAPAEGASLLARQVRRCDRARVVDGPHVRQSPCFFWIACATLSLTPWMLKLAPFCIGGNSMNVSPTFATSCCTKTNRQNSWTKKS